jgi:thioredoxin reductase
MMTKNENFDAVVIGGSYAGLAAALSLGRALKNVLIIDSGNPCNKQTPFSHNFITQDGAVPAQITAVALSQVLKYPNVKFMSDNVIFVSGANNEFLVTTASGKIVQAKKLLFATGIKDTMPAIKGFAECWGISIIHCPYCHGYEYKGTNTGLLMNSDAAADHAQFISNWAGKLTLFTNGKATIAKEKQTGLTKKKILVTEKEIKAVLHTNGQLECLVFADGQKQELDALYAVLPFTQHTALPQLMGCNMTAEGYIQVDDFKKTTVPGIFAAGDNTSPMRSVAIAVAAGTFAGVVISKELINDGV